MAALALHAVACLLACMPSLTDALRYTSGQPDSADHQHKHLFNAHHHSGAVLLESVPAEVQHSTLAGEEECPGGVELYSLHDDIPGDVELNLLLDDIQEVDIEVRAEVLESTPPPLNGTPWCEGTVPSRFLADKVALVLIGQPFRAKNFQTRRRELCSNGTLLAQQVIAESHERNVIKPLEERGFEVDIFLTDDSCSGAQEEHNATFDPMLALKQMYGRKRIRSVYRPPDTTQTMYNKFADGFAHVNEVMKRLGGLYEYIILLRYDIMVDRSLMTLVPAQSSKLHRGLTFYQHAHDFMWSFPGELWSCMLDFWKRCMTVVGPHGLGTIGLEQRRQLGCFRFGPLELAPWYAGYGFHVPLEAISRRVKPGALQPQNLYQRTGTTVWDIKGIQHRCKNDRYDPPKHSVEPGYMPACYHIG